MPDTTPRDVVDAVARAAGWTATPFGFAVASIYRRAGDVVSVLWTGEGEIFAASIEGWHGTRLGLIPVADQGAALAVLCGWLKYSARGHAPDVRDISGPLAPVDADADETAEEYDEDTPTAPGSEIDPDAVHELRLAQEMGVY